MHIHKEKLNIEKWYVELNVKKKQKKKILNKKNIFSLKKKIYLIKKIQKKNT